jgi:hypothetical protein
MTEQEIANVIAQTNDSDPHVTLSTESGEVQI